ncbi:Cullin [Sphaerosporella brunnea]|uniref:Cullin n=1 Tax=Sphaerosporella brunnea TaxID=1250544 RepID=A0A5J5F0Q1_9PEZI|nr:Cullin [Sphaerosporella brunnea]
MQQRPRGRIRPPRRGLVTDQVDFDEVWEVLSQSLREIHQKNASTLSFEALYRNAYKLVLKKHGDGLYKKVKELVSEHLQYVADRDVKPLVPSAVITGSSNLFGSAAIEKRIGGSKFLEQLQAVWEDHQLCMSMITDVLMYMNRIYCADHKLPTTYATGMGLFREFILLNNVYNIGTALNRVILDQIQMERDGDVISHGPIRSCIYMLECLYESEEENEHERIYLTRFENDFLAASSEFYKAEGQRLLHECDAATYLQKVDKRLREERDRCVDTISSLSESKILAVVDQRLIKENIREVLEMDSGIKSMLDHDRFGDLRLLYKLISRVDPDKSVLKEMACNRLIELGKEINANLKNPVAAIEKEQQENGEPSTSGAAAVREEKSASNATALAIKWVNDVLMLKDRYDRIWEQSFGEDKSIQTAITRAVTQFVNDLKEAPEYISLFIDDNLRRGIKGRAENEVDEVLDKAITLFRYLTDKDLFERHYKIHLSRRLLANRSLSHDTEKQMIGKLKVEVGVAFTSKLEGMFKDMTLSEELSTAFRRDQEGLGPDSPSKLKFDLSMNVLTTTFWPTKAVGSDSKPCIYPPEIEAARTSFTSYYLTRFSGRKLIWKPNMGSADIKATFKGRKHEFNVPTFGMVILLAFNDLPPGQDTLSYTDLKEITAIPDEDLIRNLQSLAVSKTRLLTKMPMSKDVKPTDTFKINDQFSSKTFRFRVGLVAINKAENEREKKETNESVEKDRGYQIEAAIVRTMKQRKTLSHQELLIEVVEQLKNRFAPDISMVKKRIESLIEREYLERVDGRRETYKYLA